MVASQFFSYTNSYRPFAHQPASSSSLIRPTSNIITITITTMTAVIVTTMIITTVIIIHHSSFAIVIAIITIIMPLASHMLMQPWNLCLAADKLLHDHPDSSFTKHENRAWSDDGGRFRLWIWSYSIRGQNLSGSIFGLCVWPVVVKLCS